LKISAIQSQKVNNKISFTSGVTNLYSDFDGTYMPREYRHDAFCKEGSPERINFVTKGKEPFQNHFDKFKQFLIIAKGTNKDKFNFAITSGRNRFEYNYYMQKIRSDGLNIPLPDKLIVNNGGDVYSQSNGKDFFASTIAEPFEINNYSQEKRDIIKKLANGWDGNKIRKIINETTSDMYCGDKIKEAENFSHLTGFSGNINQAIEECDKLIHSQMSKDEIRIYIQNLATDLKTQIAKSPELQKEYGTIDDINWKLGELAYRLDNMRNQKPQVFETLTDGYFYGGKELSHQVKEMNLQSSPFVAIREDGNLGFHLSLSKNLCNAQQIQDTVNKLSLNLKDYKPFINIHEKKDGKFGEITILPKIGKEPLDKIIDPKLTMQKIVQQNSNDLVITAGDSANDLKMINLLEYLENPTEGFSKENLKGIYKLPVIAIYVDNTEKGKPLNSTNFDISISKIDDYFNSDGNVHFIHVDPNNPKKPQTLQEAVQVAIKEFSKRNKTFKDNLPEQMKRLIAQMDYEYPIDRDVSKLLEKQLGTTLWNPIQEATTTPKIPPEKPQVPPPVKKKINFLNAKTGIIAGIVLAIGTYFYLRHKKVSKTGSNKNIINNNPNNVPQTNFNKLSITDWIKK
jgi:hypothetical protein